MYSPVLSNPEHLSLRLHSDTLTVIKGVKDYYGRMCNICMGGGLVIFSRRTDVCVMWCVIETIRQHLYADGGGGGAIFFFYVIVYILGPPRYKVNHQSIPSKSLFFTFGKYSTGY